jgi:glycosyltransferase involved in cell wall biosynthesis
MRIASITAGAAGMYCGSCMRDNTLAAAIQDLGHDALLFSTYTPIRTDEPNVSQQRVFFGGINVYLEQKSGIFRHTPRWLDRLFNGPRLLRWVSKFAVSVRAEELGDLTLSMLDGTNGNQRKEVEKLVEWFETHWRPDVILLTNVLLSGIVPELKRRLKRPIVATLQGDDIFLEMLPSEARAKAIEKIRANCEHVDGYIATCNYYADFMSGYLSLSRERFNVVYPGIKLEPSAEGRTPAADGRRPTIGYFARIAPEKGLHVLADAFIRLRKTSGAPECRLRFSGWLGEHNKTYLIDILKRLADAGLANDFEHVDSPTHDDKMRFLQSIDVLSVPAPYREPKGLYVLEALAQGVPVVQPRHGSFPELIEMTGGGLLVNPEDPADLANGLRKLVDNSALRQELGRKGQAAVRERFTAEAMARNTLGVLQRHVNAGTAVLGSAGSSRGY